MLFIQFLPFFLTRWSIYQVLVLPKLFNSNLSCEEVFWISNFSCTICVALSLIQIQIDVWNITSQNYLKLIHYVHLTANSSSRFHPRKHMSIHTDRTNELARAWKDAWMSTPCCACQHVCEAVFVVVGSIEYGLVVFSFMWSRAVLKVNIHSSVW